MLGAMVTTSSIFDPMHERQGHKSSLAAVLFELDPFVPLIVVTTHQSYP